MGFGPSEEVVMTWSEKQQLPSPDLPSAGVTFDAPAPGSGYRLYVIGSDLTVSAGAVLTYDPSAPSPAWSPVASLIGGVYNGVGATVGPGGLHVIGGSTPTQVVTTHQIYDAAANAWALSTPLLTPRAGHVAVTGHDGTIYVIGGYDNNQNTLSSVEALHPSASQWTNVASMNMARYQLAVVTGPDGKIYAIGGVPASGTLTNTVEVYDPAADSWTIGPLPPGPPSLPVAMEGIAAAVGPDGLIYVMGGADYTPTIYNTLYSYDPATAGATWVQRENMPTPRANLVAVTGPDGLIYAIGGGNTMGFLDNVEAYAVDAAAAAPDPYIGNGTYQSPDIILTNQSTHNIVPIGGAPGGAWDTLLIPYSNYTISCVVYNDANVAAPNTKVRFWHFPGGVGTAGALISEVTVTVPANGSIVVKSPTSSPFQSGAAGAHECAAVSIANAQSQYFSNDPTTATAVIDPTVPHPAGSGHFGSAWRNTNSVTMGGEIKVWNFPFVANLDGIEPARVKITATATKVAADWDRTDEMVKLRKVVEGACSNCRLPLFLIPEIRTDLPPADCDVRIRVGGNDVGSSRSRGNAEHHAAVKPGENVPFQVSGRIPDDAQAGDIFLVNVAANYPAARGRKERIVEYLEVIYVR
jgi:N-acetylneuraminic acid mutarotase